MKKSNKRRTLAVTFTADGNFATHVTDLKQAEDFYAGILGFKLLKRSRERLVCHTGKINLYILKDDKVIPFIPALEVKNYEKAKEYLMQHGCRINKEWKRDRALYFEDPFGTILDLVEK